MKRSVIVLLSALLSTTFATVASAELKIGVVDVQKLAHDSPPGKAANDALSAEFLPKQKEIETQSQSLQARQDKLKKDEATMTEVQKAALEKELRDGYRDLQAKQTTFQEDLTAARQAAQEKMLRALNDEVQAFARAQGYDLILTDAAYVSSALDVTNAILQGMLARKPAAAAPAAAPPAGKPPAK